MLLACLNDYVIPQFVFHHMLFSKCLHCGKHLLVGTAGGINIEKIDQSLFFVIADGVSELIFWIYFGHFVEWVSD